MAKQTPAFITTTYTQSQTTDNMNECTPISHCLACGSSNLTLTLDLGKQALANNCIDDLQIDEPEFPLAVNRCEHCNHLQLTHVVDPALIYTHYLYVSGTSKTGRDHFEWFARFAQEYVQELDKGKTKAVLDIGCNDGTQLDYFKLLGFGTYGIDPAENLYATSSKNHRIYCDFFDTELADQLESNMYPDIIVAQNSFAHNPDPLLYLTNLKRLMDDNSRFFIQTSQADMVLNDEFDTIYHEHVNFYNINSMNELCKRAGLELVDVVKTPIHGTSYIFIVGKTGGRPAHIANLIANEAQLMDPATYHRWAGNVYALMTELQGTIEKAKLSGYELIGYGAAAKGNTLLNSAKIKLDAIIDDNPLKQGLYSPGMNVPIVRPEWIDSYKPSDKIMFVPLAWNFYKEIKNRILVRRSNPHDRFVRYFPEVKVEE
jgi:SAM-dependent methyltransferase